MNLDLRHQRQPNCGLEATRGLQTVQSNSQSSQYERGLLVAASVTLSWVHLELRPPACREQGDCRYEDENKQGFGSFVLVHSSFHQMEIWWGIIKYVWLQQPFKKLKFKGIVVLGAPWVVSPCPWGASGPQVWSCHWEQAGLWPICSTALIFPPNRDFYGV